MDEIIDILDEQGKPTGQAAAKKDIHRHGHRHQTAHIRIYNSQGQLLLQQRSLQKVQDPGLRWPTAWHVDAGESPIQGAVRELAEELGIKASLEDLKTIGIVQQSERLPLEEVHDNEHVNLFLLAYEGDIESITIQPEEVEGVMRVSYSEYQENIKKPDAASHYSVMNDAYYQTLFAGLDSVFSSL